MWRVSALVFLFVRAVDSCSCSQSTVWDGSFGQFTDGSFCGQNFGQSNPYISAGGGAQGGGGSSGPEPCNSGQYTFDKLSGWLISVNKSLGERKVPYRAFAYIQWCNGASVGSCWTQNTVRFSFSFKTQGLSAISAYVKLLFWTDSGNIVGLLPPNHPKGDGTTRLLTFPKDDYPNQWGSETTIEDDTWYHLEIDFQPQSSGVTVSLGGTQIGSGTIPVNMLDGGNGPQLGVYSFDFGGPSWPAEGMKLWLHDACVGSTSGNCPSLGGPAPTPGPQPTPWPVPSPGGCSDATPNCQAWAANGECDSSPDYMRFNCPASCGYCTPAPQPTPPHTPQPTPAPQPTPTPGCSDQNQNCQTWAASGECDANPDWMLENCPASCNVCTPAPQPTPQPTPAPTCFDQEMNCQFWAVAGECEANPDWMLVNCPLSCGVCSGAPPPPMQMMSQPEGPGLCCFGGRRGSCGGGWCGESRSNCEGNCNGEFYPAAASLASSQARLRSVAKLV